MLRIVETGCGVVDVKAAAVFSCSTTAAGTVIAGEDGIAVTVKAGAGVQGGAVTGQAQPTARGRF